MNVKGYDETEGRNIISSETGSAGIYETLRRSDPDLAAIPNKVSTLDRRLHMKAARPRSLDLSNWSVDSRSSLYTSSGSEDSASHTHTIIPSGTTCATTTTCVDSAQRTMTLKRPAQQRNSSKPPGDTPRTVLILSGILSEFFLVYFQIIFLRHDLMQYLIFQAVEVIINTNRTTTNAKTRFLVHQI